MPFATRCSQIAWVIARMWSSLKEPRSAEPRWPLVPKATRWVGSPGSGCRSWYSRSSLAGSISRSLGAGFPASGEVGMAGSSCERVQADSIGSAPGVALP